MSLSILALGLVATAQAQTPAAGGAGGFQEILPTILMFGLMFLVFYFLLIRPQQKKLRDQQAMISAIRRGDRVIVNGLIGTVSRVVSDDEIQLELAEGVRVRAVRSAISTVLTKGDAKDAGKDAANKDDTKPTGSSASDG